VIERYLEDALNSDRNSAHTLLPHPIELDWAGNVVLVATRHYKPSYGGVTNHRFREATRETGITQEEWDAAKVTLISRGLLKQSSAITDEGRNAVHQFSSLIPLRERSVSSDQ
jgi:hypothetical protein